MTITKQRSVHKTKRKSGLAKGSSDSKKIFFESDFSSVESKPASSSYRENTYLETNNEKPVIHHKKSDDAEVELDDDEKIHSENPYGDFYANETIIREIPLNQLESVIAENRMNGDDGFQKEYATLPYGERYECDAGKSEENMAKNRFKTTFPCKY
ncbi:uncharacterized protein LOC133203134 [Saccostrea echinata]|uniref:uncharacterized protein LOC133203134 n=1 Tax=Saccostrea echinata TaxID=191078 RepID=UPI002A813AE8|nr:uncharacterized protein LOC133203134 [Saccostrea echinata]